MASKPGVLTNWPWQSLGSFKYMIVGPWVGHSIYTFVRKEGKERRDIGYLLVFPFAMLRLLLSLFWISFSRHRTAQGTTRILDKPIDFDQVDRESNWDDQILMTLIISYVIFMMVPEASHLPFWRTDGAILIALLHAGPVEFLYYWLHRALHHHFLYSRYHSHHHSSIVTQPISAVIHPFVEIMVYLVLFLIPQITSLLTGTASLGSLFAYVLYIDFMNNMGHCNFEFLPTSLFRIFPPLKYLMYTPSFHSLHHTQFRTNYSLFMPFYDYLFNTMDKSSNRLHQTSLVKSKDSPNVVHLTHLTSLPSIFHIRLGSASLASRPQTSVAAWYLWAMWPVAYSCFMLTNWTFYGRRSRFVVVERNTFNKLVSQTWVLPNFKFQYSAKWQIAAVNTSIEEAILAADEKGTKVISLGLLNQGEEVNRNGEEYVEKHPQLKIKVVDGSSLAAAVVLNAIPLGTTHLLLLGHLSKVALSLVPLLCLTSSIQVNVLRKDEYEKLIRLQQLKDCQLTDHHLVLAENYDHKIWLVGDGVSEIEQLKAPKGTIFIPFNQFPPNRVRKDCFYHSTPAFVAPTSFHNLDSCEDWLPRRVLSAWRVAGIVHALEEWQVHECGDSMFSIDKVWQATLQHGFRPFYQSNA